MRKGRVKVAITLDEAQVAWLHREAGKRMVSEVVAEWIAGRMENGDAQGVLNNTRKAL